jgi:hypothetical protein
MIVDQIAQLDGTQREPTARTFRLFQGMQFEPSFTLRLSSCRRLPLSLTLPENEALFHWTLQVAASIA